MEPVPKFLYFNFAFITSIYIKPGIVLTVYKEI